MSGEKTIITHSNSFSLFQLNTLLGENANCWINIFFSFLLIWKNENENQENELITFTLELFHFRQIIQFIFVCLFC